MTGGVYAIGKGDYDWMKCGAATVPDQMSFCALICGSSSSETLQLVTPAMARHNSPSAFSTQRIAAPYAGRGNRNKTVASVAPCKKQMAVINWENVLAPLDWMAVYLGLGRDNSAVEAAVVRCRSSPDLLQSLAAIEERTMQLLTETMRLVDGPVFIVSEYSTSYVELVSSLFFPRLTAALRSASTGIYVVGTPNTQLTALEMKQWKVNLLHTAILEYLFAGIDEVAATNLLARSAYGRIKVVALCANEMDTTAASGVRLIAPIAVIRHVRVQCPKARAPVSLDDFYAQLQRLMQFVRQNAN
ncbi:hypothetical protein PF006_g21100 [Phytophthora fragariae]|uniref:Uncharacterized protein n=2 Tax=Phytophthora fragariae TaxID=53985 RepID=A0A6A3S0B3_9STRA|nr:hypothetical protein PF006_g21100 [Phytophthora fragariae]